MKALRQTWFDDQLGLDPEQLVFIDETGASTNLARRYGRCRRGRRLRVGLPHGHHKTITFVSGLRRSGLVAPKAFDGAMNAGRFEAWLRDDLGSTLRRGDIVVMDNLSSHKNERVKQVLASFGASVLYLPPYTLRLPLHPASPRGASGRLRPDLNPIENA